MLSLTQAQVEDFCEKLIINAATSSFTRLYEYVRSRCWLLSSALTVSPRTACSKVTLTAFCRRETGMYACVCVLCYRTT